MLGERFGGLLGVMFLLDYLYPPAGLVVSVAFSLWVGVTYLKSLKELRKEGVKLHLDVLVAVVMSVPIAFMLSRKAVILPLFIYMAYKRDSLKYYALTWKDVGGAALSTVTVVFDWTRLYVVLPYVDDDEHVYIVGYGDFPKEMVPLVGLEDGKEFLELYRGLA